jgi:hypothetical protein
MGLLYGGEETAMKRRIFFGATVALLVVLAMGMASRAMADGWIWMHAAAASIQSPENTNWSKTMVQGLDLDLKHGKSTWIHIAVPTPKTTSHLQVDKINLMLFTGSADVKVTAVHLYSGGWTVQEINESFYYEGPTYFYKEIAINSANYFRVGCGISLQITAGTNSNLSHRFCLAAAGVHWLEPATAANAPDAPLNVEIQEAAELMPPPPPAQD